MEFLLITLAVWLLLGACFAFSNGVRSPRLILAFAIFFGPLQIAFLAQQVMETLFTMVAFGWKAAMKQIHGDMEAEMRRLFGLPEETPK